MPTRRLKRFPLRLPVSVGRKMAAISTDLSADGFCLEVMTAPEKGAEIDGYVLLGEKELEFEGRVSWVEPANPQLSHWAKIGVQFKWLSPGLRALLCLEARRKR